MENILAVQSFIDMEYARDFVTRFLRSIPSIRDLAIISGFSETTVLKLKNPDVYGPNYNLARSLWSYLKAVGFERLSARLNLDDRSVEKICKRLFRLNFSNSRIVEDSRLPDYESEYRRRPEPRLLSEIVELLRASRGTVRYLNLEKNFLYDEGLGKLAEELSHHPQLRKLNVRDNKITAVGEGHLEKLKGVVKIVIV